MSATSLNSRRQFLGAATAGAALAVGPLFSRNTLFAAQPAGSDWVHLNFNESPYGPPESAQRAMREAVLGAGRYYHDWNYDELRTLIGREYGLAAVNVLLGAGSTEILKLCDDVFLRPKPRLVAAEPAYEGVIQYAVNSSAAAAKVPLTADFRHDLPRMAEAVTRDTGLVYICNPNNPTGTIVTRDETARFLDRIPDSVPVVVDEAYSHFAGGEFDSAIRYVVEGRNVVVVKTFSKIYGLAGMRVGYALARRETIERLRPFGVHFAVGSLAAFAARAALADRQHVDRVARENRARLATLYDEMKSAGFPCIESQASFAMIHVRRPVAPLIEAFAQRKILVGREFSPLGHYLRVTMGTAAEMQRFYRAFHEVVRA